MSWLDRIHVGDCRVLMRRMIADGVKVQCIVSSPPYWGLRDYGVHGQIGLEPTFAEWLARMVEVFELARDLLTDDGTLWLNLGDSYSSSGRGGNPTEETSGLEGGQATQRASMVRRSQPLASGVKQKELIGQPWRAALALQANGWYLRSDIVWAKPNPMPESCSDRPTKSHEYVFLLSRAPRYFYDAEAIAEPRASVASYKPLAGHAHGESAHNPVAHSRDKGDRKTFRGQGKYANNASFSPTGKANAQRGNRESYGTTRNARSVWTIATEPFHGSHFATFPRELVRRCVLAGSRAEDVIFDPFMGSGTVAEVAASLGRQFIGCELNAEYASLFEAHRSQQQGLAI